jgi:hypothetical protein
VIQLKIRRRSADPAVRGVDSLLIHLTFTNKTIHSIQHHSFAKPPS